MSLDEVSGTPTTRGYELLRHELLSGDLQAHGKLKIAFPQKRPCVSNSTLREALNWRVAERPNTSHELVTMIS